MAFNKSSTSDGPKLEKPKKKTSFRNTKFVIEKSLPAFDAAYDAGVMGVHGLSLDGRRVRLSDGRCVTDFVRCSYLGLDNHPKLIEGAVSAVTRYGSLHWSCARTRLNSNLLRELEERLAILFSARVIAYSTVMVANMGALPLIASGYLTEGVKPVMVFDRLCHVTLAYHKPAMADETKVLTIDHNDIDALEQICQTHKRVAYVADGVYSMGGHAPVAKIQELQNRYGLFLYIDDAHGISIFGEKGEGYARSQFPNELGGLTIIAASLGKGFGASGGILMLGTKRQEDLFRRYSLAYAFSAAPNLAAVGAALASAQVHETAELAKLQKELFDRIRFFDQRVDTVQRGDPLPIRLFPVGNSSKAIYAAQQLLESKLYTSAVFFPTVAQNEAGIRICLSTAHSLGEIDELCEELNNLDNEMISASQLKTA
ncbi:aminotransferase class I/II-fold pyridoxal phosphate-dependent enzyme [Pelagibius litoralis]|uniref:Aminotransferase class I/II-fold pyridoxal phosphate-dependent enzyme n=1 Tax=Pelagibius litoralis TaxID=374515 RepID=A0A967KAD9_9PROT|nr:aminotransferase class I/II-fold pyridoxal phosphate-dependent enzyme [Pelagibius litoralis]NIA70422.1 aminotransferase class I/II-fold pyridoxal phosphate-dependent enzyme [Pelagibius litoralis]